MCKNYGEILTDFYRENGILACDFNCKNQSKCMEAATPRTLSCGAGAHIGSKYGYPFKIVVVSLDRGDGSGDIGDRTRTIENLSYEGLNPHMKGTLQLLKAFLKNTEDVNNFFAHFAMTNSAKCCGADKSMASVPEELYKNCAKFSRCEIELLEPDIIVTQGKRALFSLEGCQENVSAEDIARIIRHFEVKNLVVEEMIRTFIAEHVRKIMINDFSCWLLVLPHPSARAGRWQNFESYHLTLSTEIVTFLINKDRGVDYEFKNKNSPLMNAF